MEHSETPTDPRGGPPAPGRGCERLVNGVKELVRYARAEELGLADELLTDILARLCNWPVEEPSQLR